MDDEAVVDELLARALPTRLHARWALVPRLFLYQLFFVGALVGLGTGLSVMGLVLGSTVLSASLPIALGLAYLQNTCLARVERARIDEARQALAEAAPPA